MPLAAVRAMGRTWRAMTQAEVQDHVRERLQPGADPNGFIVESVNDAALRRERSERLKEGARPFTPANFVAVPI
ncbi:MAG: hypothetical protein VW405_18180 [Rhodospirillaceae bacterium]